MATNCNLKELSVCVVGAGVCGLVSVKACLESSFRVTCFEKSSKYGGLWNYRPSGEASDDDDAPFEASVMKTTILNTSKELSAFSDFAPPALVANFMRHNLYMDYIEAYVANFNLRPHLQLEHEILQCQLEWDEAKQKTSWLVEVLNLRTKQRRVEKFDKLMIAVGHHNVPFVPNFEGQKEFGGRIIHSARLKDILHDKRLIDKRVLVVGLGNSACDAANDLALVAEKCYVSCHRGQWFLNRLDKDGLYDFQLRNRYRQMLSNLAPSWVKNKFFLDKIKVRTNHKFLGLKPQHKPTELVPIINDLFPYRVFTGGVVMKGAISSFTQTGVRFEGEEEVEYKVDVVVLATGYVAKVPFLNELQLGLKSAEQNEYELYLNMFAPKLTLPAKLESCNAQLEAIKSLVFIGLVQPSGSITVAGELQARYAMEIFAGNLELPSIGQMVKQTDKLRLVRAKSIRSHSRDQLVGDWLNYLDLIAEQLRVKPNLTNLFFGDFVLWRQLFFGPAVPYQYRLCGAHKWPKARETILSVGERVSAGINEGKNELLYKTRRKHLRRELLVEENKNKALVSKKEL